MFLVNGERAILRQFNRNVSNNMYDDVDVREVPIKVCEYDVEQVIRFGIYTIPEAKGYYQIPRYVDIREGDQIVFIGNYFDKTPKQKDVKTVLEVHHNHLFNRKEIQIAIVK